MRITKKDRLLVLKAVHDYLDWANIVNDETGEYQVDLNEAKDYNRLIDVFSELQDRWKYNFKYQSSKIPLDEVQE